MNIKADTFSVLLRHSGILIVHYFTGAKLLESLFDKTLFSMSINTRSIEYRSISNIPGRGCFN